MEKTKNGILGSYCFDSCRMDYFCAMKKLFIFLYLFFFSALSFASNPVCLYTGGGNNPPPISVGSYFTPSALPLSQTTDNGFVMTWVITSSSDCYVSGTGKTVKPWGENNWTWGFSGQKKGSCPSNQVPNSSTGACESVPGSPGAYPPPDENGDCAASQTLTNGVCVPDTPAPTPGDMVEEKINCGPGQNGVPSCDFSSGPIAANCGGWQCYASSDGYIPLSEGGGCHQYEGSSDWWCSYNVQVFGQNTSTDPLNPSFVPVPVSPGSNYSTAPSVPPAVTNQTIQIKTVQPGGQVVTVNETPEYKTTHTYDPNTNSYTYEVINKNTGGYTQEGGLGSGPVPGTVPGTGSGPGGGTGGGEGSGGYGPCSAPFSCSGDPVQCAIAQNLHEIRCSAGAPDGIFDAENPNGIVITQGEADAALNKDGSFDFDILQAFQQKRQAYINFSSGCMGNIEIPVFGQTVIADLTVLCELGNVIKLLFHIAAYLLCIRIIHQTLV